MRDLNRCAGQSMIGNSRRGRFQVIPYQVGRAVRTTILSLVAVLLAMFVAEPICHAQGPIEIRFYNSTSVNATNLQILPYAGSGSKLTDVTGNYIYWDATASQTLNGTSTNTTLQLSSLAYTPPVGGNKGYYSAYTTNFNNAAWYIGVNTPSLSFSQPRPSPGNPSSNWGGYTYQPFELTIDGNVADTGDITYINQFGLPMQMRTYLTNASAPSYTTGFTGTDAQVLSKFQTMATRMQASFPNAFVTSNASSGNPSGLAIIAAPNTAPAGSLTSIAGGSPAFEPLTDYFNKIKNSQGNGTVTTIKDFINLTQNSETYSYYYDFKLDALGANNTLKLSGNVTVVAGAGGNSSASGNYTGLSITIGSDNLSDPAQSSYWASSFAYLAPTPANTSNSTFPDFALSGDWSTIASSTGYNGTTLTSGSNLFGTSVIGRIMGDLAAGLAFGFVDSDILNPNYLSGNVTYGDSPSGSWWGGNEFPASDGNFLLFEGVQPDLSSGNNTFYSEYGGILFDAVPLAYGHPIADRMQFYKDIQIPVYGVTTGNGTQYIETIEIEFWDGINSVPEPATLALIGSAGMLLFLARRRKRSHLSGT